MYAIRDCLTNEGGDLCTEIYRNHMRLTAGLLQIVYVFDVGDIVFAQEIGRSRKTENVPLSKQQKVS